MTSKTYPLVEVALDRIEHNLTALIAWCGQKGIGLTSVTKGVCGALPVARLLADHDIHSIGDSHIQNIRLMKENGVPAKFILLRSPIRNEIDETVAISDYCLVSAMDTIREMDQAAKRYDRIYPVIIMIELGDRREGIIPDLLDDHIRQILELHSIRLAGIGANLTCLNGIKPTEEKMNCLSDLADHIESRYSLVLEIISGGNSANFQWMMETEKPHRINHLRMGEAVLLGTDPLTQAPIDGLQTGAFVLSAEVIESMRKPSLPDGIPTYTAFGDVPKFTDEGDRNRALLAIGLQDLDPLGCAPVDPSFRIIGTTSDHMVLDTGDKSLRIGDVVQFNLTYRAMLPLMISPYVEKAYV